MSYQESRSLKTLAVFGLFVLMAVTCVCLAQAPLTVDNLTDKSTHNLRTWFRVPSSTGYTYQLLLDGQPVPTDLTNWVETADYHELAISRTNTLDSTVTNLLVRFIVRSERGAPENGLERWTPYPLIPSTAAEFDGAQLSVIAPAAMPPGLPIPVIAWVEDAAGQSRRANGQVVAPGFESSPIPLLRGVGSGFLPAADAGATLQYQARIHSLQDPKTIAIDAVTEWTPVSGLLSTATAWPANSRVLLTNHLTVAAGATLTIGPGTVVQLAPLVNVTNSGRIVIEGTTREPVLFTSTNVVFPERPAGAWGGFILRGAAAQLVANGTIFTGGGGATDFDFSPGASHRSEQAVLLLHSGARVALTNCYIINTAGQVGNGYNSDLTLDHCLFQRAITGGEYAGGTITIHHSAIIEFPADDGVVDSTIANADYDAIYFTEGTHLLRDTLVGFAKDDALDSGSGGTGSMLVTNGWIESALHEAQAWSGGGRTTRTYHTVSLNSGQGIECGWSTGDNSPDCFADGLLSTANAVGARVGDNYDWSYNGFLRLTNSLILHNGRDVFLKTWNAVGSGWQTNSWVDRLDQVDFRSNLLTTAWIAQPGNDLWEPARDAARLAAWMTAPADAPVGIGFAVRTNHLDASVLSAGVPVRLSTFTTHPVSVECRFQNAGVPLATNRLVFAPGETVKHALLSGWSFSAHTQVDALLQNPDGAELTGETLVTCDTPALPPRISCWVATNTLPLARLPEGLLVRLNEPSGLPVTVSYTFTADGLTLATGTLTFDPGQTVQPLTPIGFDPAGHSTIELALGPASGASLSGITTVFYGAAPLQTGFAVATDHLELQTFTQGVPLALSQPAAVPVQVQFQCESATGLLTNGSLSFAPGETLQTLRLPTVAPTLHPLLAVTLTDAQDAVLTQPRTVFFLHLSPPNPGALVEAGSRWRYLDTGANAGTDWRSPDYDDSGWSNGLAQLGFGDGDEATPIRRVGTNGQNTVAFYFRQPFVVEAPAGFTGVALWLLRDDGGVVYLNGTEAFRSPTLAPAPATIDYLTLANHLSATDAPPDNAIDTANLDPALLREGTNVVAVEIHQHRGDSSDVSFDLSLTGQPTPVPAPWLRWGRVLGAPVLVWGDTTFALEHASSVTGPWTRDVGATSPFNPDPQPDQVFYRLRR